MYLKNCPYLVMDMCFSITTQEIVLMREGRQNSNLAYTLSSSSMDLIQTLADNPLSD